MSQVTQVQIRVTSRQPPNEGAAALTMMAIYFLLVRAGRRGGGALWRVMDWRSSFLA
jgi:hypothetical protein